MLLLDRRIMLSFVYWHPPTDGCMKANPNDDGFGDLFKD